MKKVILASGSPRRQQLLAQLGVDFTSVPSDFEERLDDSRPVEEIARGAIVYAVYGEAEIDAFLNSGECYDKAGATAIQSSLTPPIDHIEGDYETVLGLPTGLLKNTLEKEGIYSEVLV